MEQQDCRLGKQRVATGYTRVYADSTTQVGTRGTTSMQHKTMAANLQDAFCICS